MNTLLTNRKTQKASVNKQKGEKNRNLRKYDVQKKILTEQAQQRIEMTEELVGELEDSTTLIIQSEQQRD